MRIGEREFDLARKSYIMGILNVTPDSFSDGGRYTEMDQALYHVEQMISDGMDILDIGGESTRPGYKLLEVDEEISRVAPVIEAVKSRFDVPISLDTYKSKVAKAGIEAGADMINDIWGLKYDMDMAKVIAEAKIPCCLMHNRRELQYTEFMPEVMKDLRESIIIAKLNGIKKSKIILDPGVGFAKSYHQNLEIIGKVDQLLSLGFPVLLGCSRKSVIGYTLDLPTTERIEGTLATTVVGRMKGCSIFRVHDVKENARILKMTDAILRWQNK